VYETINNYNNYELPQHTRYLQRNIQTGCKSFYLEQSGCKAIMRTPILLYIHILDKPLVEYITLDDILHKNVFILSTKHYI
jgi:hypothetical protein